MVPNKPNRVLLIDDDQNLLKITTKILTAMGFKVLCANDGESGLRMASQSSPSVIILELLMPGMDGFEFLQRFNQTPQGQYTPIIVWTMKDLTEHQQSQLRANGQAVVLKGKNSMETLLYEIKKIVSPMDNKTP